MCKRALLSMFYKPDRSGSTTVTFFKVHDSYVAQDILGQAAIKIHSPANLYVFVFGKATWILGHSIKCGLESWSGAWRLGVKFWSEILNKQITIKLYYLSKL